MSERAEFKIAVPSAMPMASDEQLKEAGIDPDTLRKMLSGKDANRLLLELLIPEFRTKSDLNSMMRYGDMERIVGKWRRTELAYLSMITIAMSMTAKQCMKEKDEAMTLLKRAQGHADSLESQLRAAMERNGIYNTRDKQDAMNARAQVEKMKGEALGNAVELDLEQKKVAALQLQLTQLREHIREANTHGQTALERLTDRFPSPTPFFATIISELKQALGGLTQ